MRRTNIGFINGPRYADFEDHEAGYYSTYEEREEAKYEAINDETQFDTTNKAELAELWFEFCIENGIITFVEETEVEE